MIMSKQVQDLFSTIAPSYDFLNRTLSFSIDQRWRRKTLLALGQGPYSTILDLCAGTLDISRGLHQRFPQAQIVAADFALAMLEQGSKKIPPQAPVAKICADGHCLPFADEAFAAVVSAFGIRNLENRDQAAFEIRRVLKATGRLVVLEFFRPTKLFTKIFHRSYGKHVLPKVGGAISKNQAAYEYLQNSILDFFSVAEYAALLKKHGFKKVSSQALSGGIAHIVVAEE